MASLFTRRHTRSFAVFVFAFLISSSLMLPLLAETVRPGTLPSFPHRPPASEISASRHSVREKQPIDLGLGTPSQAGKEAQAPGAASHWVYEATAQQKRSEGLVGNTPQAADASPTRVAQASALLPTGTGEPVDSVEIMRVPVDELPPLNPGMVNVTAPRGSFYRFLPKGARFSRPITVNLPYDPELLPPGTGPEDVRTYYYDETAGRFLPLERTDQQLAQAQPTLVASLTTHFTDMINAVIVRPEHPSTDGFNPNTVSGIAAADPAAGMTLVEAPEPRSDGAAVVSYPIQLPPARGRHQPVVGLAYSSERGYGLAGEGWDVSVSSIEIDTRFGAPRYETRDLLLQFPWWRIGLPVPSPLEAVDERYLLDGQPLVPSADEAPCFEGGGGTGRVYLLRKEGTFNRIVRCGADPWDLHWEVTTQDGTRFAYGLTGQAHLADPVERGLNNASLCVPWQRNIGRWLLERVTDVNENVTDYRYSNGDRLWNAELCCLLSVADDCPPNGTASRELEEIAYARNDPEGLPHTYAVRFEREPRDDQQVSARLGFRVVRDTRLTGIVVQCVDDGCATDASLPTQHPDIIHEYRLSYREPNASTLFKSLLTRIGHCGAGGCDLSPPQETRFTYTDVDTGIDGALTAFGEPEFRDLPASSDYPLSLSTAFNLNVHGGAGKSVLGFLDKYKSTGQLGGSLSFSPSLSAGLVQLVDLNGDGLPDQVPAGSRDLGLWLEELLPEEPGLPAEQVFFNSGRTGADAFVPASGPGSIPPDPELDGHDALPKALNLEISGSLGLGVNLTGGADPFVVSAGGSVGVNAGVSSSLVFPTDANGDGLLDFVVGPAVLLQDREAGGRIVFREQMLAGSNPACTTPETEMAPASPDTAAATGVMAASSELGAAEIFRRLATEQQRRDPVYRWRAPRDGKISMDLTLTPVATCQGSGTADPPQVEILLVDRHSITDPPLPFGIDSFEDLFADLDFPGVSGLVDTFFGLIDDLGDRKIFTKTAPILPRGTTRLGLANLIDVENPGNKTGPVIDVKQGAELLIRVASKARCEDFVPGIPQNAIGTRVKVSYLEKKGHGPLSASQDEYLSDQDFRTEGRIAAPLIVPLSGRVRVSGRIGVAGILADEVAVQVVRRRCTAPQPYFDLPKGFPWTKLPMPLPNLSGTDTLAKIIESLKATANLCDDERFAVPVLRSPGAVADLGMELEVEAGDALFLFAEGKSPIDPASIKASEVTLTYLSELAAPADAPFAGPSIASSPPASLAGNRVYQVPVHVGWRRLTPRRMEGSVPVFGTYKATGVPITGQQKLHIKAPAVPASWFPTPLGHEGAHVLVQITDRHQAFRLPLEPESLFSCPEWHAADSGVCPELTEFECTPLAEYGDLPPGCAALPCPVGADDLLSQTIESLCSPERHPKDWCPGDALEPDECARLSPSCYSEVVTGTLEGLGALVGDAAGLLCRPPPFQETRDVVCGCPDPGQCLGNALGCCPPKPVECVADCVSDISDCFSGYANHAACLAANLCVPPMIGGIGCGDCPVGIGCCPALWDDYEQCLEDRDACGSPDCQVCAGNCLSGTAWDSAISDFGNCVDKTLECSRSICLNDPEGTCDPGWETCFNPSACLHLDKACTPMEEAAAVAPDLIAPLVPNCSTCPLECLAAELPCPIPQLPCIPESCENIVSLLPKCATEGRPNCGTLPTPFYSVNQLINLGDLPAGTRVFVSIEPPEAAFKAIRPENWDAVGQLRSALGWLNPAEVARWVAEQAYQAVPPLVHEGFAVKLLSTNVLMTQTQEVEEHFLLPGDTLGLPLPATLPPASGLVTEEGYRGWGYGEWASRESMATRLASPGNVPGLPAAGQSAPFVEELVLDDLAEAFGAATSTDNPMSAVLDALASPGGWSPAGTQLANLLGDNGPALDPLTFVSAFLPGRDGAEDGPSAGAALSGLLELRQRLPNMGPLRTGSDDAGRPAWIGSCAGVSITGNAAQSARCLTPEIGRDLAATAPGFLPLPDLQRTLEEVFSRLHLALLETTSRGVFCPLAPTRTATSKGGYGGGTLNFGLTIGAKLSGSETSTHTDYRDMTGDGIPDLVYPTGLGLLVLRSERQPLHGIPYVPLLFGGQNQNVNSSIAAHIMKGAEETAQPQGAVRAGRATSAPVGTNREKLTPVGGASGSVGLSFENGALIDVNGDGLVDQVAGSAILDTDGCNGLEVRLNTGSHFLQPECWPDLPPELPDWTSAQPDGPALVRLLDDLGDGLPKGLAAGYHGDLSGNLSLGLAISNSSLNGFSISGQLSPAARWRQIADVNGDSLPDIITVSQLSGQYEVAFNLGSRFTPWVRIGRPNWIDADADLALSGRVPQQEVRIPFTDQTFDLGEPANAFLEGMQDAFGAASGWPPHVLDWSMSAGYGGGIGVSGALLIPGFPTLHTNGGLDLGRSRNWSDAVFTDLDGDGLPEPVRRVPAAQGHRLLSVPNLLGRANRLQTITNPLGGVIELGYERAGNTFEMPRSRYVLASVVQRSGAANGVSDSALANDLRAVASDSDSDAAFRVSYADGRYDRLNREPLGFGRIRIEDVAAPPPLEMPSGPALRVECRWYDVASYETAGVLTRAAVAPPSLSETADACAQDQSDRWLSETIQEYELVQVATGAVPGSLCPVPAPLPENACRSTFHYLASQTERTFEDGVLSGETQVEWTQYDAFGNPLEIVDKRNEPGANDDLILAIGYRPLDPSADPRYLPALAERLVVTNQGEVVRRRTALHDDYGRLTEYTEIGDDAEALTSTLTYHPDGNLATVTEPTGYEIQIHYDGQGNLVCNDGQGNLVRNLPTCVSDNLNQNLTRSYDYRFGVVLEERDPNGDEPNETLRYAYDDRGRLTSLTAPGESEPAISMSYACLAADGTTTVTGNCARTTHAPAPGSSAPLETYTKVDGLGRALWVAKTTVVDGAPMLAVTGRQLVDPLGRARIHGGTDTVESLEDLDTIGGEPLVRATRLDSDLKGRVTRQIDPPWENDDSSTGDIVTLHSYSAISFDADGTGAQQAHLLRESTDPNGGKSGLITDILDQEVAVLEFPDGQGDWTDALATRYLYTALGELSFIIDPAGNSTELDYDAFGRRVSLRSPDTGLTTYAYDDAGRLASTWDARHNPPTLDTRIAYSYQENSSRATEIARPGQPSFRFEYGMSDADRALNRLGRAWRVTDEGGVEEYAFDALGRVVETRRTFDGQTVACAPGLANGPCLTSYRYDPFGRVAEMTYPDGQRLRYGYGAAGQVTRVEGLPDGGHTPAVYVQQVRYDEDGRRTALTFGNGAVQSFSYDPSSRRLNALTTTASSGKLQQLSFGYDPVGNIRKISSVIPNPASPIVPGEWKQFFGYDALHRLTSAKASLSMPGWSQPKTHVSVFEYDDLHNITRKFQRVSTGSISQPAASHDFNYQYASERPHVLTGIAGVVGSDHQYDHDLAGNLVRSDDARGTRELSWTPDGMLRSVSANGAPLASYRYDSAGTRVAKTVDGQTSFYLGPHAVLGPDGTLSKHVFAGNTRIATDVLSPVASPLRRIYVPDHLGSTSLLLDESGAPVETVFYFPYGEPFHEATAGPGASLPQAYRFSSKELDPETGYSYFGARYLDHRLVMWISPDPGAEENPASRESWNPYGFVLENPVNLVDEDGRQARRPPTRRRARGRAQGGPFGPQGASNRHYHAIQNIVRAINRYRDPKDPYRYNEGPRIRDPNTPLFTQQDVEFLRAELFRSMRNPHPSSVSAKGMRPFGFKSLGHFRQFAQALRAGLRRAGYKDVEPFFQGSAVTGRSHRTGEPFDVNRISDFDIALASPSLFARARELGVPLRSDGTRTMPLTAEQVEALGLSPLQTTLTRAGGGRPVNFMIYGEADAARTRAPSMRAPDLR